MRGGISMAVLVVVTAGACAPTVIAPPPLAELETRALWITRFDWSTEAELEALVDRAAAAGFNTVYLQVRNTADAYYASDLEPWAARLTGRLGGDPGWDPLATVVERGRSRGVAVHAWINVFPAWTTPEPPPEGTPRHVVLTHPEWLMADTAGRPLPDPSARWLSPAHPGARAHVAAVAADIARRYAVAGVHLDFIRYPDRNPADTLSLASWRAAREADPQLTLDAHRRGLVTATVLAVRDSVLAARAGVELSAAVWGIHRAPDGWGNVSTGYDDRLQDARRWAEFGLVDALVPMVYWPMQASYGDRLDYALLVDEHAREVTNARVIVGITLETVPDAASLTRHIERAREAGADGVAVLSARLMNEGNLWDELATGPFRSAPAGAVSRHR
jgi:uncharacterized lipoprotein YddW (UPF0748 family)